MSLRLPLVRAARQASTKLPRSTTISQTLQHARPRSSIPRLLTVRKPTRALFSTSSKRAAGLMPGEENPSPKNTDHLSDPPSEPTPLSDEAYHQQADAYLENMMARIEELQENREDVEAEFTQGVLTLTFPPNGTYVVNKQPANKQIWLSSPITGPKRYDWVVEGEGMSEKQGAGVGDWVYLRDGNKMSELLVKELGIRVGVDEHESPQ